MRLPAYIEVRKGPGWPHYGANAGPAAAGYEPQRHYPWQQRVMPGSIVVTWTLWSHTGRYTVASEHLHRNGERVLCMENGWLPVVGGRRYYQLALWDGRGSGINGSGSFPVGDERRWEDWNVALRPWRRDGDHVLVCAQRGVREKDPQITHGASWPDDVVRRLRRLTDRPIHWRPHPGNNRPCIPVEERRQVTMVPADVPLERQLAGAWACLVYTSTSATEAILSGIPVLYDGPNIMCRELAGRVGDVLAPPTPDREPVLARLAWAQWTEAELATGEPFVRIVGRGER